MSKFILLLFLFSISQVSLSQDNEVTLKNNSDFNRALPRAAHNKIDKVEKVFKKAELTMGKAEKFEREIDNIRNNSRHTKTRKVSKLEGKMKQKEIEAYYLYHRAHKKLYSTYKKNLKAFRDRSEFPDAGNALEKGSSAAYKKSKKYFRKAENKGDIDKAYPLFADAYRSEMIAINNQIDAFSSYQSTIASIPAEDPVAEEVVAEDSLAQEAIPIATADSIIVEEPALPTDSLPTQITTEIDSSTLEEFIADTLTAEVVTVLPIDAAIDPEPDSIFIIVADTLIADSPEFLVEQIDSTDNVIAPEPEPPPADIFFGIQVLSKSSPATEEQLKQIYTGDDKPYLMKNNGYYRYLVGKFKTLFEARVFQNQTQVKGFIVAYKEGEKIPVQEAVELLNKK